MVRGIHLRCAAKDISSLNKTLKSERSFAYAQVLQRLLNQHARRSSLKLPENSSRHASLLQMV